MEENKNIEEQPEVAQETNIAEESARGSSQSEMLAEDNMATSNEAERGVPIGKFKSVEDLYEAYNNLQAEFTRKSQKLSALEKDKTQNQTDAEDDGDGDLKVFLSKNQGAVMYADEIKERAMQDDNLKGDERKFEKVWAEMLYEKLTAPDKANDPLVQNLILKDDELKNLVVKDYMKQLQSNNIPIVMSSNSGERVTKTVTPKPDSFEQAKKVVLDLLK